MNSHSTRHLVDPQLASLLESMPTVELTVENLPFHRARTAEPIAVNHASSNVERILCSIPVPRGAPEVCVRIYRPQYSPHALPCIFHIHGGGYVMGSAARQEPLHRSIVSEIGCAILSVDYRLAPETVFPGAIEDCYAALSWLFAKAPDLGVDRNRIGLMGESAGGGLAAALALLTRDRGGPHPIFQHLIYPMIDDRTCLLDDPHALTGEFVWTRQNNRFGWSSLLGVAPGSTGVSPYAAVARSEQLAGLPPTFISVGALDLFVEEDIDYARSLMRAGVPTELHVYPGAFHGFQRSPNAEIAIKARTNSMVALSRALHRQDMRK